MKKEQKEALLYTESKPTFTRSDHYMGQPYTLSFFDGVLTIDATRELDEDEREDCDNYSGIWLYSDRDEDAEGHEIFSEDWQFLMNNTEVVIMRGNIVDMPYPVFNRFKKLHTIVFSGALRQIGYGNFHDCPNLRYLHLTKHVESVYGLTDGNSLLYIGVAEENEKFCSVNGYLMSKDQKKLVAAPGGLDVVEIPEGCEIIGQEALYNSHKKIIIPASVKEISPMNFYSSSLAEIVLGDYKKQYPLVEEIYSRDEERMNQFSGIYIH